MGGAREMTEAGLLPRGGLAFVGEASHLQVITAQTVALQNERNDIEIQRRRMDASVLLVKAVGGGWDTSQLPRY